MSEHDEMYEEIRAEAARRKGLKSCVGCPWLTIVSDEEVGCGLPDAARVDLLLRKVQTVILFSLSRAGLCLGPATRGVGYGERRRLVLDQSQLKPLRGRPRKEARSGE